MPSNLVCIVAEARRRGSIELLLPALRREIAGMASRLLIHELRDDAISDALVKFMSQTWPSVDLESHNDRQVATYCRLGMARALQHFARGRNSVLQYESQDDESFREPVGPLHSSDPLAQEMFREILDVLNGRERKLAELLAQGHSVASAARVMRVGLKVARGLQLSIRGQLKFCLS